MKHVAWRQLAVLLTLAFALRLAAGWVWQSRLDGPFGMPDSESYWTLAASIAEGRPYQCGSEHARVFRTPGYPLLLAPIVWLAGDGRDAVLWARAEAALLGTLAVAAVWWLTRLLFDDRAALVAAALATVYPGAIALSMLVLSEAPFCPLMLLELGLCTIAWNARSKARTALFGFGGGLVGGAATLMRPSWLLFTPLAAAVLLIGPCCGRLLEWVRVPWVSEAYPCRVSRDVSHTGKLRLPMAPDIIFLRVNRRVALGCCMILGLVLAMLPWWIRNAQVTGHFVPTTLQVGASLYDGLNPDATGASNMDFMPRFIAAEQQRAAEPGASLPDLLEVRLDRRLRAEALDWAWAHPGRAVQLAGVKFLRMWNVWPNEPRFAGWWPLGLAVLFMYTPLLIFAIIGAWRTLGRGWPYILCWLPAAYFTLLHVVFVSSLRYREPAMLALLALAVGGTGIGDWRLGIRKNFRRVRETHRNP